METNKRGIQGKLSCAILAASCSLALAGPAAAEGWYAGASVGQTSVDIDCDLDITCSADDSDTGLKIFAGNQFNPNIAVEFGYVDFGEAKASGTDSFLGVTSATIESNALFASVNGLIPVGQGANLFGKVGVHRWDVDVSASSSVFGSGSESDDGFDLLFGIGASFDIGKTASIRAEWEKFTNVGDENTTGESDVDMLSVGVAFKFK